VPPAILGHFEKLRQAVKRASGREGTFGAGVVTSSDLRAQAQRCYRLARSVNAPDVVAMLERMARELEEMAAQLQSEAGEAPPTE
jgi:hypothetical protein